MPRRTYFYKWKRARRNRKKVAKKPKNINFNTERTTQDPPMGYIMGQKPDSIEEWRIAVALWKLGVPFEYQKRVSTIG